VDVYAPAGKGSCAAGGWILSLYPEDAQGPCTPAGIPTGYSYRLGTTLAAAQVAGVGALLADLGLRGAPAAFFIEARADTLQDFPYTVKRINARRAVGL